MEQQITTFNILFNHIKEDGVYLCEDIHTSYWLYFGGGFKRRGTFVEFSKNFIDQLNAFHSEHKQLRPNKFTLVLYDIANKIYGTNSTSIRSSGTAVSISR